MVRGILPRVPPVAWIWWAGLAGLLLISVLSGTVEIRLLTLVVILLCAACEAVDSSLGMGYGTTLTPIMLLMGFEPMQLVPTILVSEFLSGFSAAFFHAEAGNLRLERGSPHLHAALILSGASLVGVVSGIQVAFTLSRDGLVILISMVIILAGGLILVGSRRAFTYRLWKIGLLGVVASFNKSISGGGYGPLMTTGQVLSGVPGRAAVGITSVAEGFTCLAAASLFLWRGGVLEPGLLIPVLVGAMASVPVSAGVVRRIPEGALKAVIAWLTIGLGAFSLLRVLWR